jgi:hypothetical protein
MTALPSRVPARMPSRDDFAGCLGSSFRVVDPSQEAFELALVQVSELKRTPWQENFSILFQGPAACMLPQRILHLVHDRLGALDLFLVPTGQQGETIIYEAVFNRLTKV